MAWKVEISATAEKQIAKLDRSTYDAYANPAFRDARMAVAVLGQTLRLVVRSAKTVTN